MYLLSTVRRNSLRAPCVIISVIVKSLVTIHVSAAHLLKLQIDNVDIHNNVCLLLVRDISHSRFLSVYLVE